VSRLLEPRTRPRSQTWKPFLRNHLTSAAAVDFFTLDEGENRYPNAIGFRVHVPDPRNKVTIVDE
jgi:hypothetical protein